MNISKIPDLFTQIDTILEPITFSPSGNIVALGSEDGNAYFWNLNAKTLLFTLTHKDKVTAINFKPDGTEMITTSRDKTVVVWNIYGAKQHTFLHDAKVPLAIFSPDQKQVISISENKVFFWNNISYRSTSTLNLPLSTLQHPKEIWWIVFSSNGTLLGTTCSDAKIRIFNAISKIVLSIFSHSFIGSSCSSWPKVINTQWIRTISFSPTDDKIATASHDQTVRIWDKEQVLKKGSLATSLCIFIHHEPVTFAKFSLHHSKLLTIGFTKTMYIWDVISRRLLANLSCNDIVNSAEFSPDENHVLATYKNGKCLSWDISHL